MDKQDLIKLLTEYTIDSTEARGFLGVSRQRIARLKEEGRLVPLEGNLYWKEDVESYAKHRKRPHKP